MVYTPLFTQFSICLICDLYKCTNVNHKFAHVGNGKELVKKSMKVASRRIKLQSDNKCKGNSDKKDFVCGTPFHQSANTLDCFEGKCVWKPWVGNMLLHFPNCFNKTPKCRVHSCDLSQWGECMQLLASKLKTFGLASLSYLLQWIYTAILAKVNIW